MFENLVAGSLEPEILKLLREVKKALDGVEERLKAQQAGSDLGVAMSAHLQLGALDAWYPAIGDLIAALEKPAAPASHAPRPPSAGGGH